MRNCSSAEETIGRGLNRADRVPIGIDNSFGEQIPDALTGLRHIGSEDVVETAVFADDDNNVFDRGFRILTARRF